MLAYFDSERPTYLKRDEVKTSIGLPSKLVWKRFSSLRVTSGGTLKSVCIAYTTVTVNIILRKTNTWKYQLLYWFIERVNLKVMFGS